MGSTDRLASTTSAYDIFAAAYNASMAEEYCRKAFPAIERLLLDEIRAGGRVLDLCCGSGQMAREMIMAGLEVTGLDRSPAMIELARRNAPQARFVVADAREFAFVRRFDAVLSSFNSLAHAESPQELAAICRNVCQSLCPGGVFVFDASMEEQYANRWSGSFGEVRGDCGWLVSPSYSRARRTAENRVTVMTKQADCWRKSQVTITQKCHTEQELRSTLLASGFHRVESFDAERDLAIAGEAGRRFFVARF